MAEWTTPDAIHSKCGEHAFYPATQAIDDNTTSFWYHAGTCYCWIIFDMGETKTITKIRIYQRSEPERRWGLAAGLYVYVGDNPADLGDAVWDGVLSSAGWQESGAFSKNGRYIKLASKTDVDGQFLPEFDAYVAPAGVAHEKTVTELLGLVDSFTAIKHRFQTVTDILGLSDSFTQVATYHVAPTDILGLTDTATTVKHLYETVTETLGLIDTFTVTETYHITQTEILGLSDSVTLKKAYHVTVIDVLGMVDTVPVAPGKIQFKPGARMTFTFRSTS